MDKITSYIACARVSVRTKILQGIGVKLDLNYREKVPIKSHCIIYWTTVNIMGKRKLKEKICEQIYITMHVLGQKAK